MKKTITILGIASLLFSCNNHNEVKEFLKSKKNISDLELKDFQFNDAEMSDREYFNKMSDYYTDMSKKDGELSAEAAINDMKEAEKYLDSAGASKGNKKYKMTTYFKLTGKDTTKLGYLYYNELGKLINVDGIR